MGRPKKSDQNVGNTAKLYHAFTLTIGPREGEMLRFLQESEGQCQSTIIRRCICEIHDRVVGKLPLSHTRFMIKTDDLERRANDDNSL